MNTFGDQNSDEWDRIKNYVGGAKKPAKHPIQQEIDRVNMKKPQHFDGGGDVLDASKQLLPPASMGAPSPFQSAQPQIAPPSMPPPQAPIKKPIAPPAAPIAPQAPPMAPPASAPSPDAAYNPQANQALGGISPQQIQQYLQKLDTPTSGERAGNAVSGAGDALVSLGGGHSNFQGNLADRNQNTRENLSKIPGQVSTQGKEQYGLSKEMAADDPKSMRSFVQQQANAPLLKQAGFTPQEIKQIPASAIEGLQKGALSAEEIRQTYGLKLAEQAATNEYHRDMTRNAATNIANTAANQALGRQETAAEALEKRGFLEKAKDAFRPSTETKELQRVASGGGGSSTFTPDVTAYAQKHGISPEQAQSIKDKRTGGQ